MYRKTIKFDPNSYLEVASRITTEGESLMLALRGHKNEKEISVSSVLMADEEVRQLVAHLTEWLNTAGVA